MDKLKFTVWYDGYKNLYQLYNLLEKYKFFKPKEMYIDETNDSPYYINKMESSEIKKRFYDIFENKSGRCITIGGYGFSLLLAPTINIGDFYIISFDISPKVLKNDYASFESLFKEIIELTGAFYGKLDSIENGGNIMDAEKEDTYKPDEYVQALFWGNYFGGNYAIHPNVLKIVKSNDCIAEQLENGWFVKLSDSISGYASEEVKQNRKKLRKYIKSITGNHYIRYKAIK